MGIRRRSQAAWAGRAARQQALVRDLVEDVCNQGQLEVLDALLAPGYRTPKQADGAASSVPDLKRLLAHIFRALPDARWLIEEQIADGRAVVTRLCVEGTHQGPLCGIAPTGRRVVVNAVVISHFFDDLRRDRIETQWAQVDLLGLLDQLGVLPHMELERVVTIARLLQASARLRGYYRRWRPHGNPA